MQSEGNMLTCEKGKSLFLINDDQEDDDFHLEFDLDTLNYPDDVLENNEFNYLNLIVTDKSIVKMKDENKNENLMDDIVKIDSSVKI
jgi:hypothetical protein